MPIRIGQRSRTRRVELCDVFLCEIPSDRAEVFLQLFFVAGSDDDARHRWSLQQPVQCHLRDGFARVFGDQIERIYNAVQQFIRDLWSDVDGDLTVQSA